MTADPLRILVIDDEKHIRQSFSYYLEDLGYEVLTAENGKIGLELMAGHRLDLVLLDLRMPEVDGLEALQQGRKIIPETPMIVISGANRIGDVVRALRYGAWEYLEKPVQDLSILGHAVEKALEKARLVKENQAYQRHLENMVGERTRELETANTHLSHINLRLRKIVKTAQGLTCCKEMTQFSKMILEEFADQMGATGGSLYMVEDGCLKLMHALDPGHAPDVLPFPLDENSILNMVLKTGKPVLISDIDATKDITPSSWGGYKNGSVLVFPILDTAGIPVGTITIHSKEEPPFVDQDKEIGAILASYSCETLRAVKAFETVHKSEHRYRTLFEKASDAIFMVDINTGQYIDANRAAQALTGRSGDELKGLTVREVAPEGMDEQFFVHNNFGAPTDLGTVTYVKPDNTRRTAKLTCVPLDGDTVIGIARDITKDLEMEKQLRQSRKMEAIGTLAGGIAHDFNNILSGIFGYAQLAEMNLDTPDRARQNLEQVVKGAERAGELVQQILTFSRQVEHERRPLKLYLIVKETVKFLRSSIPASIEILERINSKGVVLADTSQVHQVIMNLCTNASHAMADTGGTLTVSLDDVDIDQEAVDHNCPPGSYIQLEVRDTGKGIDQEILDRIFDPYFTTKEISQGTGLGLAVVEGVVKKHEGFINVAGNPGEGAVFRVFFPVESAATGTVFEKNNVADIARGTERIMLVEDEETILEATWGILEQMGYRVSGFRDGVSALAAFESAPQDFDLVITDMTMPRMNGNELSCRMMALRKDIPVILCTGFHETFTKEAALASGIRQYLQKPVTGKELARSIRQELVQDGQ